MPYNGKSKGKFTGNSESIVHGGWQGLRIGTPISEHDPDSESIQNPML